MTASADPLSDALSSRARANNRPPEATLENRKTAVIPASLRTQDILISNQAYTLGKITTPLVNTQGKVDYQPPKLCNSIAKKFLQK